MMNQKRGRTDSVSCLCTFDEKQSYTHYYRKEKKPIYPIYASHAEGIIVKSDKQTEAVSVHVHVLNYTGASQKIQVIGSDFSHNYLHTPT